MVRVMVFSTTFNNISVNIVVVSFIGGGNRRKPPTCLKSMTIFMTYCYIGYTSPRVEFELATLVVIGTYYTGSCTSNYHTITTTTASLHTFHNNHQKTMNCQYFFSKCFVQFKKWWFWNVLWPLFWLVDLRWIDMQNRESHIPHDIKHRRMSE